MRQVSLEDAHARFLTLIQEAVNGEEIIITKDNRPLVRLTPVMEKKRPRPQFGSAKGLISMSDDFDAALEDFKDYMP